MRKALCLAAVFALIAPSAFGQEISEESPDNMGMPNSIVDIYLRPSTDATPDHIEFGRLLRQSLERSRMLNRTDMPRQNQMELEAPVTLTKSEDGKKINITFEVTPANSTPRSYKADCSVRQLDRCAEAVVRRAEILLRQTSRLPGL